MSCHWHGVVSCHWHGVMSCHWHHLVPLLLNPDVLIKMRWRSVLFCRGKWAEKRNKSPDTAFQWPKFPVEFRRWCRKKPRVVLLKHFQRYLTGIFSPAKGHVRCINVLAWFRGFLIKKAFFLFLIEVYFASQSLKETCPESLVTKYARISIYRRWPILETFDSTACFWSLINNYSDFAENPQAIWVPFVLFYECLVHVGRDYEVARLAISK